MAFSRASLIPITNGHLDVIRRGVKLFDELIVAVGINPEKRDLFTLDERVEMIRALVAEHPRRARRKIHGPDGRLRPQSPATALLRGIRDVSDLRYEFQLALANRTVGGVETVFIMAGEQYALTSSSLIRQVVPSAAMSDNWPASCPNWSWPSFASGKSRIPMPRRREDSKFQIMKSEIRNLESGI